MTELEIGAEASGAQSLLPMGPSGSGTNRLSSGTRQAL